jgi:hypothetical protein
MPVRVGTREDVLDLVGEGVVDRVGVRDAAREEEGDRVPVDVLDTAAPAMQNTQNAVKGTCKCNAL